MFAENNYGRERVHRFLRDVLGGDQPEDLRSDFRLMLRPIDKVWQEHFDVNYEDFKTAWLEELALLSGKWESHLQNIPRLAGRSELVKKSEQTREVLVMPDCQPEPAGGNIEIMFEQLKQFDRWEKDRTAKTQVEKYEARTAISLSRFFPVGSRLRWTVKVHSKELDCDLISGWERRDIK